MSNSIVIPKSHVGFIFGGSFNWVDDPLPEGAEIFYFSNGIDEDGTPDRRWVTKILLRQILMDCQRNPDAVPDGSGVIVIDGKMRGEILGEEIVKRFYQDRVDGWTLEQQNDGSGLLIQPVLMSELNDTQQKVLSAIAGLSEEEANLVLEYAKEGRKAVEQPQQQGVQVINTPQATWNPTSQQAVAQRAARRAAVIEKLTPQQLALLPDDKRSWTDEHVAYAEQLVGDSQQAEQEGDE